MGLLPRSDSTVAIKDNYTREAKRAVGILALDLEHVIAFQFAGKSGDRQRSNDILAVIGGSESLNRDRLRVARDGCGRSIGCRCAAGSV